MEDRNMSFNFSKSQYFSGFSSKNADIFIIKKTPINNKTIFFIYLQSSSKKFKYLLDKNATKKSQSSI